MTPSKTKRVYRITTVNLTKAVANTGDPNNLAELEKQFEAYKAAQAKAVEKGRLAQIAQADAEIAARELQKQSAQFFLFAGKLDTTAATEGIWPTPPFRNESGDIVVETPFSQRDARTASRVMHSKLADEAKNLETRFGGLFETEEDTGEEDN